MQLCGLAAFRLTQLGLMGTFRFRFINPRRACAARVTVVVLCVCMCVYVSTHTCRLTHWNHKREIPTDSAQYRDRFKFCRFPKNASFKSYGLPRAAPAS